MVVSSLVRGPDWSLASRPGRCRPSLLIYANSMPIPGTLLEKSAPCQFRPEGLVVPQKFLAGLGGRHGLAHLDECHPIVACLAELAEQFSVRVDAAGILVQLVDVARAHPGAEQLESSGHGPVLDVGW